MLRTLGHCSHESSPIELYEPLAVGSNPEIPIRRLCNNLQSIQGQSIFNAPVPQCVARLGKRDLRWAPSRLRI